MARFDEGPLTMSGTPEEGTFGTLQFTRHSWSDFPLDKLGEPLWGLFWNDSDADLADVLLFVRSDNRGEGVSERMASRAMGLAAELRSRIDEVDEASSG